jgi:uncharacterized protein YoxC
MIDYLKKSVTPALLAIVVMFGGKVKTEYDRIMHEINATKQRVDDLLQQSKEMVSKVNQMIDTIRIRFSEEQNEN